MLPDNSKEIAHEFLSEKFSYEQYLAQLPKSDAFECYELMIQVRSQVSQKVISDFKKVADAHQLVFQATSYNKKENFINFFINANTLQQVKKFWCDILTRLSNKQPSVVFARQSWAVVLYANNRTDEYVVLDDTDLPLESQAIAHNFLDDSFSWHDYQNQFPEDLILRKYDMEFSIPIHKARKVVCELKKITRQHQLIYGVTEDDTQKDKVDFYIIGYSFKAMQNIWRDISLTVNANNSPLAFLRNNWTIRVWRSNFKDNAILLASCSTRSAHDVVYFCGLSKSSFNRLYN